MTEKATLSAINPVIPAKDMWESLAFYVDQLGFVKAFAQTDEPEGPPTYAGVVRDGLCLHLQAMVPGQDAAMPLLRFKVSNIESRYEEYRAKDLTAPTGQLEAKPWGSRDFGLYDPSGAGLVFYEDL